MDHVIETFIESIELEEMQIYQNMAVIPLLSKPEDGLLSKLEGGLQYITLKEAMDAHHNPLPHLVTHD